MRKHYHFHDKLYHRDDERKGGGRVALKDRVASRMKELGFVRADGEPNARRLAKETGVSYGTANEILSGTAKNPQRKTLEKLAAGLGTTVDWLLAEDQATGTFDQGAEFVVRLMREAISAAEEEVRRQRKRGAQPLPPGSWKYVLHSDPTALASDGGPPTSPAGGDAVDLMRQADGLLEEEPEDEGDSPRAGGE